MSGKQQAGQDRSLGITGYLHHVWEDRERHVSELQTGNDLMGEVRFELSLETGSVFKKNDERLFRLRE